MSSHVHLAGRLGGVTYNLTYGTILRTRVRARILPLTYLILTP